MESSKFIHDGCSHLQKKTTDRTLQNLDIESDSPQKEFHGFDTHEDFMDETSYDRKQTLNIHQQETSASISTPVYNQTKPSFEELGNVTNHNNVSDRNERCILPRPTRESVLRRLSDALLRKSLTLVSKQ